MPAGRPKNIDSPEQLWQLFNEYREDIKGNPIQIVEQKKGTTILGKGAVVEGDFSAIVKLPAQRPLTMEGFENYCADQEVIQELADYFSNKEKRYEEFAPICRRIRRSIRQDQIEGGMAGIYNASITQRLNGLVDRQQSEGTQDINITVKRGDRHGKGNNVEYTPPGPEQGQTGS